MEETTVRSPKTLTEAIRYYSDPDVTLTTMVEARWPNGVTCPTCVRASAHRDHQDRSIVITRIGGS